APAPTMTASTQPERGTSSTGVCRGAASAGLAATAAAEARNERRVQSFMIGTGLRSSEVYHGQRGARAKCFSARSHLSHRRDLFECASEELRPSHWQDKSGVAPGTREIPMLDAAIKALSQMLSPPFRSVLWKSVGVALVLIVFIGFALQRLLAWLAS